MPASASSAAHPNQPAHTPLLLIIRDGWGTNPHPEHHAFNAVELAKTPVADKLMQEWPTTLVATSGEDVGLTEGTMGNSEVGHQNIGAGRVVYQDAVRITIACRDDKLKEIEALTGPIVRARDAGKKVHLMGICSDAGVHGQMIHLEAILKLCKQLNVPGESVCIHLFTDGRDTGPFTGKAFAEEVVGYTKAIGMGRIVSVMGRYFAMDRDNRWERVAKAYGVLTGRGPTGEKLATAPDVITAIQTSYDNPLGETMKGDEFVAPTACGSSPEDVAATRIQDGDTAIFYNYRGDRPREICAAFLEPEFFGAESVKPSPDSGARGFDRGAKLDLDFVILTPYSERLAELAKVAFPKPPKMVNILGEFLAKHGLTQFRCAETEKFPHVTFFFNDYRDEPFEGEHREIIQSPKVATYDMQPEMSAHGVRDAVLRRLAAQDCEQVIAVNFANGDMVGHTGSLDAAIKACETVDACVGELLEKALARGGSAIVFADHGNAEQMFSPENNSAHTAHTTYTVPLIVVGEGYKTIKLRSGGRLADVAPTALAMLGLEKPAEMTGESLIA